MALLGYALLLLLAVALLAPVRLFFDSGPGPTLTLRWLLLKKRLLPRRRKAKGTSPAPEKQTEPQAKKKKAPLSERPLSYYLALFERLWPHLSHAVRHLLRRTGILRLRLRMVVVGADAADTALRFARTNAVVVSAIAICDRVFTLRAEQVDIIPGFTAEKSEAQVSFCLSLLPAAALIAGAQLLLWALASYLRTPRPKKPKSRQKPNEPPLPGATAPAQPG